jgi:hypothetical protein
MLRLLLLSVRVRKRSSNAEDFETRILLTHEFEAENATLRKVVQPSVPEVASSSR